MSKRMTDERLAEIEHLNSLGGPGVVRELLQALKAERECVEELEAKTPSDWLLDNAVLRTENKELQRKYEALKAKIRSTSEYFDANDSWVEASALRALLEDDDE